MALSRRNTKFLQSKFRHGEVSELNLSYTTEWSQLNHFVILRTVLSIISQGLGLHPDRYVHSKSDTFALNVICQLLGTPSSKGWTSRRYPYQRYVPCYHVSLVAYYAVSLSLSRNSRVDQTHPLKKIARKLRNCGFLYTPIGKTCSPYKIHQLI